MLGLLESYQSEVVRHRRRVHSHPRWFSMVVSIAGIEILEGWGRRVLGLAACAEHENIEVLQNQLDRPVSRG